MGNFGHIFKLQAMVNEILDWIKPPVTALVSMVSAFTGTLSAVSFPLSSANIALQHMAWTVAIIAGLFSIANYIRNWCLSDKSFFGNKKRRRQ